MTSETAFYRYISSRFSCRLPYQLTSAFPAVLFAKREDVATMTAPIGAHIRETFKSMWNPVVEFLFIWIRLRIGLADTLRNNLGVAFAVTRVLAILALHTRGVLEEIPTQGTSHDTIELLNDKFMPILLLNFFFSLSYCTLAV